MNYKSKVLLVDDDKFGLETLEMVLMRQGYELFLAENGYEAIELATKHQPDVILLDVMMPGLNGFDVCRHLRADPVMANVPIIMVTALDDKDSKLSGIQAGADDFITKPYNRLELRTRIRTITKLNRFRHLMTERDKFEWVIENAVDGYVILDKGGIISYANRQACAYLDLPVDAELPAGIQFLNKVTELYRCEPAVAWADWDKVTTQAEPLYLVRPESPMSEAVWLQVDVLDTPSAYAGQQVIHITNVTEQIVGKRLSWAFHSQVSHKLRTPLGLFMGYLEMLKYETNELPFRTQSLVDHTADAAERLQAHLLDIFAYVDGIGQYKGSQNCSAKELLTLLKNVGEEMRFASFSLESDVDYENIKLPLSIHALELVFKELLTNAKKFHPEKMPAIIIRALMKEKNMVVQVIDDGQALSNNQLQDMWRPYFQAEKFYSGQVDGTGLGLAQIAAICTEVNGYYHAYNRPDSAGIIVELTFPVDDSDTLEEDTNEQFLLETS